MVRGGGVTNAHITVSVVRVRSLTAVVMDDNIYLPHSANALIYPVLGLAVKMLRGEAKMI